MTAWKRWQDYTAMAAGVLLFISPFVFGETSSGVAAGSAYVLGVITFVSPWVLGFAGITAIAWTAWVLGIVVVIIAGSLLLGRSERLTMA